ncbi:hypothetical protein TNCV_1351371 [Trichonephila clavipes]|nr:hypothetical protein TNCV_1351371 [Trichonephila clavipes]
MFFGNFRVFEESWTPEDIPPLTSDQSEKLIVFRKRILSEYRAKRSGLSSAQTENPVLSALADRLQEINLRVGRLQEASAVTARKSGGNYFKEERTFSSASIVVFKDTDRRNVGRDRGTNALPVTSPRRNAASEYSSSSSPRPGGRHVHFRESTLRDNYAAPGIQ